MNMKSRRGPGRAVLWAALWGWSAVVASGVAAQTAIVDVTAAATGAPLAGAFVTLSDRDGRPVRSALTLASGRAILAVERPGTYTVRAELIGFEARDSDPIVIGEGDSRQIALSLAPHAIQLDEIRVEVEDRCRLRPDEASVIGRVWEDARTALSVQAWTESEGAYRLDLATWERDLDAGGRTIERESRRRMSRVGRVPFESLPVDDLLEGGFIVGLDDGGFQYFGPDARLLLSDAFLDTHCLGLTRVSERPGALGLTFEPVGVPVRPDIRGTLWLDETTGELQEVEYGYTRAPYPEAEGLAGGRVAFQALPNGAWMIARWTIRAPLLGRSPAVTRGDDSGIRVIGIRETGGEVVGVSTLDDRPLVRVAFGSARGTVWDSTAAGPLAGAHVRLAGTAFEAVTDDQGRFTIDELPAGVFVATVAHPRLDSLGIDVPGVEAEVVTGQTTEVLLTVPSLEGALIAACGTVLTGHVRDRRNGEPIPGARVRVAWQVVERLEPVVRALDEQIDAWTDQAGRYTACGVPTDEMLRVQAAFLGRPGPEQELALAPSDVHRVLDLELELPSGLALDASRARAGLEATGRATAGAGTQGVQGVVVERGGRRPIPSADVTVRSGSSAIVHTTTTDPRGFFRLQVSRPGPYLISARALGYAELTDEVVAIEPETLTVLEIGMPPQALELDPIVVTAEARTFHLEMEGFYRRRDEGFGVHFTPEALESRPHARISDHFFGLSGVRVIEPAGGARGRAIYFRGTDSFASICWPMVYIDHHLVSTGGLANAGAEPLAVDDIVHPSTVMAVEVYRSAAEVPSEFHGPNAGCGVVVLWTRRGGG
jgi:hypothetical protein